jgi:hypothetical protein
MDNRYLEKIAIRIHQYVHKKDKTKKKWIAEGKPIPEDFEPTGVNFYKRRV